MSRVANVASVSDLIKIIRANEVSIEDPLVREINLDKVATGWKAFLLDLAAATPRPPTKLLEQAASKVWPQSTPGLASFFARQVSAVFVHSRGKVNHSTSGAKLNPATFELGRRIQGHRSGSPRRSRSPHRDAPPAAFRTPRPSRGARSSSPLSRPSSSQFDSQKSNLDSQKSKGSSRATTSLLQPQTEAEMRASYGLVSPVRARKAQEIASPISIMDSQDTRYMSPTPPRLDPPEDLKEQEPPAEGLCFDQIFFGGPYCQTCFKFSPIRCQLELRI